MPGFKKWFILYKYVAGNSGWVNWNYVKVAPSGHGPCRFEANPLDATPFLLRSEAESTALLLAAKDPDLIGALSVELRSL
jgi:hypothetical protein